MKKSQRIMAPKMIPIRRKTTEKRPISALHSTKLALIFIDLGEARRRTPALACSVLSLLFALSTLKYVGTTVSNYTGGNTLGRPLLGYYVWLLSCAVAIAAA
jgi:hypothetical protein